MPGLLAIRRVGFAAAWTVVGAAAGCAQLAGIDDTTGAPVTPPPPPPGDTLRVTQLAIGATVVPSPLDTTSLSASFLVAGSTAGSFDRVAAASDPANGGWTSTVQAAAPVEFMLPDGIPRLFALPNMNVSTLYLVFQHASPAPAPDGATFTIDSLLDVPAATGDALQIYVVGAWLRHDLVAAEFSVDPLSNLFHASALPVASALGRPKPDAVTTQDAFLVLRYNGGLLNGVAEAAPFAQTAAATMVTTETMIAVAKDQMLNALLGTAALPARYAMVQPVVAAPSTSWSMVAAPGFNLASTNGPTILFETPLTTETALQLTYGNPFAARGWHTILTLKSAANRNYTLPGSPMGTMSIAQLGAGLTQYVDPTALPASGFTLDLPAPLPTKILFAGVSLSTDGLTVRPPTSFVEITLGLEASAATTPPTVYSLTVFDVAVNATTMTTDRVVTLAVVSKDPVFHIPPEVFQTGHSYTLRATTDVGGFPSIASGNLVDRSLPLVQGYLDSGVFTVMP
jgi:hypothetical protein